MCSSDLEERLGQGREAAKEFLATNPDLSEEIDHKVRIACGLELGDERVGEPVDSAPYDADTALQAHSSNQS